MLGTYVCLDNKLLRIVDIWGGLKNEAAAVLVEDCETAKFEWMKQEQLKDAIEVHPDQ